MTKSVLKLRAIGFCLLALIFLSHSAGAQSADQPAAKCGDGICDQDEQLNPDSCPQDCLKPEEQQVPEKPKECARENEACSALKGVFCCEGMECQLDASSQDESGVCRQP